MTVIDEIAAERARQINEEGHTPERDDQYQSDELSRAAACYALHRSFPDWPWSYAWWKPTTERRDLIKAAALIVAEIKRLDRKAEKEKMK